MLSRTNDLESLVALLRRGVPGTEMPATAPQVIADEPLRSLAAYVLSLGATSGTLQLRALWKADLGRGIG